MWDPVRSSLLTASPDIPLEVDAGIQADRAKAQAQTPDRTSSKSSNAFFQCSPQRYNDDGHSYNGLIRNHIPLVAGAPRASKSVGDSSSNEPHHELESSRSYASRASSHEDLSSQSSAAKEDKYATVVVNDAMGFWPCLPVGICFELSRFEVELLQQDMSLCWKDVAANLTSVLEDGAIIKTTVVKEAQQLKKRLSSKTASANKKGKGREKDHGLGTRILQSCHTIHCPVREPQSKLLFKAIEPCNAVRSTASSTTDIYRLFEDPDADTSDFSSGSRSPSPESMFESQRHTSDSTDSRLHPPDDADAERLVYFSADSFTPILQLRNYSLNNDHQRIVMILKWMKFYSWHPVRGSGKFIKFKRQREQLKYRLQLPPDMNKNLAWLLISKFNAFKKLGLVSGDGRRRPITYHAMTDRWLDPSWDGIVANASNGPTKRISSSSPAQREKRPRLGRGAVADANTVASKSKENPNTDHLMSIATKVQSISVPDLGQANAPSQHTPALNEARSLATDVPHSISLRSKSGNTSQPRTSSISYQESLLSNLQELVAQSMAHSYSDSHLDIVRRHSVVLVPLREKKRIFKANIKTLVKDLETARTAFDNFCSEYVDLKTEIQKLIQVLDKASARRRSRVPPSPSDRSDVEFEQQYEAIVKDRTQRDLLAAKEKEKLDLEENIATQGELKLALRERIALEKAELKQCQSMIEKIVENHNYEEELNHGLSKLRDDFMDVEFSSSGSITPVSSDDEAESELN